MVLRLIESHQEYSADFDWDPERFVYINMSYGVKFWTCGKGRIPMLNESYIKYMIMFIFKYKLFHVANARGTIRESPSSSSSILP